MINRQELQEECRRLEHSLTPLGLEELTRINQICKLLNECICRNCDKRYDARKSRASLVGFCSAKCQHAKSKQLGHKKGYEYEVLHRAKCLGAVYVIS